MKLETIYQPVCDLLVDVEQVLGEVSNTGDPGLSKAVRYTISAGGKRLRPALVLLSARACGCKNGQGTGVAVAMELIHTASLVHDDIIDNADIRRGLPTVNSTHGTRMSVLVGDFVYSRVMGILADEGNLEILKNAVVCAESMIAGEMTQTAHQNDTGVEEQTYYGIIAGKTASLLSCACKSGAMLGEPRNGEIELLSCYGTDLGMAFQITDDLMDVIGDEDTVGKPLGNDVREGRMTLPYIYAMKNGGSFAAAAIEKAFSSDGSDDTLSSVRSIVEDCGGIQYSLERARTYADNCKSGLESLPASDYRDALTSLADYVIDRLN